MSEERNKTTSSPLNDANQQIPMGLLFGAALGVVIWLTTGLFIFFPVFVGAGLSIGAAIAAERNKEEA